MSLFKKTYFISLLVLGFAALYYFSASAQEGSEADIKWHTCAQAEMKRFVQQGPEKVEKIMCNAMFQVEPGPECDEGVAILAQLGFLDAEASKFFYNEVIVPACGEHPPQ